MEALLQEIGHTVALAAEAIAIFLIAVGSIDREVADTPALQHSPLPAASTEC